MFSRRPIAPSAHPEIWLEDRGGFGKPQVLAAPELAVCVGRLDLLSPFYLSGHKRGVKSVISLNNVGNIHMP